MIKKVVIKNFQAHGDSTLEFGPGVNVIVGNSNEGKSSILRSIRWVIDNAKGKRKIRDGETHCKVKIETDKGEIIREISKDNNIFWINGLKFEKPLSMPPEATSVLNLGPVNLQPQLKPYYLVLDPPGQIARAINDGVNLEKLTDAAQRVNKDLKEIAEDKTDCNIKVEALKQELVKAPVIKEGVSLSATLVQTVASLKSKFELVESLKRQVQLYRETLGKMNNLDARIEALKSFSGDKAAVDKYKAIYGKYKQIQAFKLRMDGLNKVILSSEGIQDLQGKVAKLHSIQEFVLKLKRVTTKSGILEKQVKAVSEVEGKLAKSKQSLTLFKKTKESIVAYDKFSSTLSVLSDRCINSVSDIGHKFTDYVQAISKNKVCPLCMSSVVFDEDRIDRVGRMLGVHK